MSDLSALDQNFGLMPVSMVPSADEALCLLEPPRICTDVQPHEVSFRRLRGPRQIARVLHLRQQIALPASAVGDASFALREKKETSRGSSVHSFATASTSVPSATCP
jgi:hypothetical protein